MLEQVFTIISLYLVSAIDRNHDVFFPLNLQAHEKNMDAGISFANIRSSKGVSDSFQIANPSCPTIFVAGYQHTGTSIFQTQLVMKLSGYPARRFPERWPSPADPCRLDNTTAGEKMHFRVYKMPAMHVSFPPFLRGVEYMNMIKHLAQNIPDLRIAFMHRDLPNTVWSTMKRFTDTSDLDFINESKHAYCEVNKGCEFVMQNLPRKVICEDVNLEEFIKTPNKFLDKLTEGIQKKGNKTLHRGIPSSTEHGKRRKWQMKHPLYPYNRNAYLEETADHTIHKMLQTLSCSASSASSVMSFGVIATCIFFSFYLCI